MSHSYTLCKVCGIPTGSEIAEYCDTHTDQYKLDEFVKLHGENGLMLLRDIQAMHYISGHPTKLWKLIAQPRRNGKPTGMAVFKNVLDEDDNLTINYNNIKVEQLSSLHVHSNNFMITWDLPTKLFELVQNKSKDPDVITQVMMLEQEGRKDPISDESLIRVMGRLFPDFDQDKFKIYHMRKIWNWYLIILYAPVIL